MNIHRGGYFSALTPQRLHHLVKGIFCIYEIPAKFPFGEHLWGERVAHLFVIGPSVAPARQYQYLIIHSTDI
jgi:hypothetical protein